MFHHEPSVIDSADEDLPVCELGQDTNKEISSALDRLIAQAKANGSEVRHDLLIAESPFAFTNCAIMVADMFSSWFSSSINVRATRRSV